ncbi:hypothetical protein TOPH_01409 [Tolypocladium ophioglossoides CBS 100239]|uniref:Protein LOT5 n=1 Tax=Tolypocladium ophioglossoides (strain CBS 100239) TaxID=1163406 RepID=A0A0L0NJF3_TOLOC|nr:hypothetical protein TOPH_01409 [Tolypocladium ophioglossoides CBS 100239]
MLATTIRSPPSLEDYIPLADYQSQTPESFADGKAVLYFHLEGATASVPKSQCGSLAVFPADAPVAESAQADGQNDGNQLVEQKIDVFVNSESFTIFSQQAEAGVSIPYPSISIHAVKKAGGQAEGNGTEAVWMQLEFSDGGANDDDFNMVELTIVPAVPDSATPSTAQKLFEAVSSCSDLHPDQDEDDEEGEFDRIVFEGSAEHEALEGFTGVLRGSSNGALPPPMPSSGGWITADNFREFFDEEGNWLGRDGGAEAPADGELGEGAGRIRAWDELEPEGVNGHGHDEDAENKRSRVD